MINTIFIVNINFIIVNMINFMIKLIKNVGNYIMCNVKFNSSPLNSISLPYSYLTLSSNNTILSFVKF